MKNNKGFAPIAIVLIVIAVLAVGGVAYYAGKSSSTLPKVSENNVPQENQNNVANVPVQNVQTNCIVVNSPKPNEKAGKTIKVTGYVNGCDNWTANTGVAGEMVVKDDNGNILNDPNNALDGNLNVSDWGKKYPDNFSGQIIIIKQSETKFGILTIKNENQSDNRSLDRKTEIRLDLSDVKILTPSNENSPTSEKNGKYLGYIKSISSLGGNYSLKIDYIQMTDCRGVPEEPESCNNGFQIINNNPLIRTFQISNTADISTITKPSGDGLYPSLQPISINLFQALFQPNTMWVKLPFWVILKNGLITEISEQYIP